MDLLIEPFVCCGCQAQFVVLFSQIPCMHLICEECINDECVECDAKVLKRIENVSSIFASHLKATLHSLRKEEHKKISLSLSERILQDKENPDTSKRESVNIERQPLTPLRTQTNVPIQNNEFELIKNWRDQFNETFPIDKLRMIFKNSINTATLIDNEFYGFDTSQFLNDAFNLIPESDSLNNNRPTLRSKMIKDLNCQNDDLNITSKTNTMECDEICEVEDGHNEEIVPPSENEDYKHHNCLFSWNLFKSRDYCSVGVQTSNYVESIGCQTEKHECQDQSTQTTFTSVGCQASFSDLKSSEVKTPTCTITNVTVTPEPDPFREISPLTTTEIKRNASALKSFETRSLLKQAHENYYTSNARKQLDFHQDTAIDTDVDILPGTPPKEISSKCPISIEASMSYGSERKSSVKNLCLVTSGLSKHDAVKVQRFAFKFKAKLTKNFNKDVTHLIVPKFHPNINYKTLKYIKAVAKKSFIVTLCWIDESLICGIIKPEDCFVVHEPGPLSCLRSRKLLFESCAFYISDKCKYPTVDEIKMLLLDCGGVIVDTLIEMNDLNKMKFFVFESLEFAPGIIERCKFLNILPVNNMWLFDCIASYKVVNFEAGHLVEDKKLNELATSIISVLKMRWIC